VGVDVPDLLRFHRGVLQSVPHDAEGAIAVAGRGGNVVRVARHAVAGQLGVDRGATTDRVPHLLENEDSRPSPSTNPSRSRSHGREAAAGSSVPGRERPHRGETADRERGDDRLRPPAIMASASPRRMMFTASPMAWAEVAQAVAVAVFGPLAPVRIETSPEDILTISPGMKKGLILRGPFSRRILWSPR